MLLCSDLFCSPNKTLFEVSNKPLKVLRRPGSLGLLCGKMTVSTFVEKLILAWNLIILNIVSIVLGTNAFGMG